MANEELIKALRCCGSMIIDCKKHCPYYGKENCSARKDADAADALEAAEKRNEELVTKCRQLESQIPKDGEWVRTDAFPHRIYCSVCYKTYVPNEEWVAWKENMIPKNYCPNCGARMKGEKE